MASFNFYQYGGTGHYAFFTGSDISYISDSTMYWYGPFLPTSDLHWNQYTGFFTPHSLLQGFAAGFQVVLWDEFTQPAQIRTKYRGEVGNRLNEPSLFRIGLSGDMAPKIFDDSEFGVVPTGSYESGLNEYPPFLIHFSGQETGLRDDYGYMQLGFSGQETGLHDDNAYFQATLTGQPTSGYAMPCYFSTSFSGVLNKKDADYVNVNVVLSGVFFKTGGAFRSIRSGDEVDIGFVMIDVSFEPPR